MINIVQVTKKNEDIFYDFVIPHDLEFFFFIVDYKQYPEKCKIYMALNDSSDILGMMVIWREHTIQLRGPVEIAEEFIQFLSKNEIEIHSVTGTTNHRDLLDKYFPNPKLDFKMHRMALLQGKEKLEEKYPFELLGEHQKEEIASFLRFSDPIYFGKHKAEDILMDENRPYFAVLENNQIISIAGLWVDESMGIINVIATHPNYRRKGYAYSMVSTGVKWLFERTNKIIIHVRAENTPAIHTYEKAGYKIKFTYEVLTIQ